VFWTPPLQDVVAGDGTTSVVVICGALLKKAQVRLTRL
jgi:chaperonin GroEL (HSP60 family)